MKHLFNTLYVTTQGAYLAKEGETVVVRVEQETKLQVPIHTLAGIVCFGQVSCSPFLMGLCGERNVTISFLTENGRFLARVQGPVSGNVLLRREQYRRADDQVFACSTAKSIVEAKIANCRNIVQRSAREREEGEERAELDQAVLRLGMIVKEVDCLTDLDVVRGKEGDAARVYFGVFDRLIVANKDTFVFKERSRRPPLDPVNALISFLYTLVVHDVRSALEGVGLDPAVGFLHCERPGRPSLALDLMEELRAPLADRLALTLINRQQVQPKGFQRSESGAVAMDDDTRKTVLTAYQERKREEVFHPFFEENIAIGLIPHAQAMLLARYLRGELDAYPPFFWK